MKEKETPFYTAMTIISPDDTIEVHSGVENSFILSLDVALADSGEPNLRLANAYRQIAHTLNSIASSLEDIESAWNAIDEDEEDEDVRDKSVDDYEVIHSASMKDIQVLINQLKADVESEFDQ